MTDGRKAPSVEPECEDAQTFIVENLVQNFAVHIDDIFKLKFIDQPLCDIFFQDISPIPEFFITHYKHKIWTRLRDKINGFKSGFVSTLEENW